ncbi:MAG: hypothetical protein EKK43_10430 [Methylobacterium sp.]|nr:MAG: hypothetical protein EKK43_10430 [Methylobacterium sp.]
MIGGRQRRRSATSPLSRAGEGCGEGPGPSGEVASLTLSLSRTGEGTRARSGTPRPGCRGQPRAPLRTVASPLALPGAYRAMAVTTDSRGHAGHGGTVMARPRGEMVRNRTIA